MRCVVLGASGFVGRALTRELIAQGHDVIAAARSPIDDVTCAQWRVELGDPNAIADAASGAEVIFHCAGIASARADRRALDWVNVAGTENVIKAARVASVRRVVMLSCADVSLINADRIHWGENRVITQPPLDAHARTKLLAEEVALAASDQRLEVTALRPAWLWGAGDRTTLPLLCAEALAGGVQLHGNGDNLLATLHIDNLVTTLMSAASAKNAPGNAYYVADSEVLTAHEFLSQLCRACGVGEPRRGVFAFDLARAWWSERMGSAAGAVSDVVRRGRGTLFDVQGAVRDLNFACRTDVATGMTALSQWVQANGGASAIAAMQRPYVDARSVDAQVQAAEAHAA